MQGEYAPGHPRLPQFKYVSGYSTGWYSLSLIYINLYDAMGDFKSIIVHELLTTH